MAVDVKAVYQSGGIRNYSGYDYNKVLRAGETIWFDSLMTGQAKTKYSITGDGVNKINALPFDQILTTNTSVSVTIVGFNISGNIIKVRNISPTATITVNIGTIAIPAYKTQYPGTTFLYEYAGSQWYIEEVGAPSVPIGGIVALHKNLTGVPVIASNFVQCDGQVLNDPQSPLNGQTMPPLNTENRFLRGSSISGTMQVDEFQGHSFRIAVSGISGIRRGVAVSGGGLAYGDNAETVSTKPINRAASTDGVNGTPRTGTETRPINMSVVYIIRIK